MNAMNVNNRIWGRVACAAVVFGVVLGSASPGWGASTRSCLAVSLPAPVQLPDGSRFPGGELRLCETRAYSPVASFHSVAVDGIQVGLFQSRAGRSEGASVTEPLVVFRRDQTGRLHLVGYAWPGGARSRTYVFQSAAFEQPRSGALDRAGGGSLGSIEEDPVLLAAQAP